MEHRSNYTNDETTRLLGKKKKKEDIYDLEVDIEFSEVSPKHNPLGKKQIGPDHNWKCLLWERYC